jgi:molybdate transport system substrate-binding protein
MKHLIWSAIVALALGNSYSARAQGEVTLIAPGGIQAAIQQLIPGFEHKTGHKVKATFGSGNGTKQQVTRGDVFDVPIVQPPYPDVIASGNVVEKSATPLASVAVGVAVKKGAPKPDISTPAAVKKTLLDAKSITSVDPAQGSVGGIAEACLDKLGIADQVKPKLKWVRGGDVVQDSVAKGEIEIALGPYLSDMKNPGIDVVGPLPPGASTPVDITGFLSNSLKDTKDAKSFLAYLRSKDAAPVWEEAKIFPAK